MAVLLNNILFYFGLLLLLSCSQTTKEYTFAEDVAPVIFNNCSPCHHKGGAAPFAMVKYQDVAKRAKMIAHNLGRNDNHTIDMDAIYLDQNSQIILCP